MIRAVIFDMDGLLLDTEKLLVRFWVQAANEAGFPMKREHALAIRSLHRKFAIPYLQGLFGEEFDYVKIRSRRMELMNEYLSENPLELKRGAKELTAFLNENGIPAAIATATDFERTKAYLTRAGIFGCFDKIVCATMVAEGKPKPDIYIYAAGELGLEPGECMALEDSPNGVRSAAAAGCVTVMVPDLTPPDEELSALVYESAGSLEDVIGIINKVNRVGTVKN
ncbi:MAG: HAD family phosphatase [Ruminococcaceae bacterium]|nr:HAD family phosphatase [Oscillospiraceae bacterium]